MLKISLQEFIESNSLNRNHSVLSVYNSLKYICFQDGVWLAGGSVMSLVANKLHTSDYDLFFANKELHESVKVKLLDLGAKQTYDSLNATSLQFMGNKIQLIKRKYYKDVEALFQDFDFTISMFAIDLCENLYYDDKALDDLASKTIRIKHINALGETFKRVIKYGQKGFKIPNQTYSKLIGLFASYQEPLPKEDDDTKDYFDKQLPNGGVDFYDEETSEGSWSMSIPTNKSATKLADTGSSNYGN